jgi:hypothetical protein
MGAFFILLFLNICFCSGNKGSDISKPDLQEESIEEEQIEEFFQDEETDSSDSDGDIKDSGDNPDIKDIKPDDNSFDDQAKDIQDTDVIKVPADIENLCKEMCEKMKTCGMDVSSGCFNDCASKYLINSTYYNNLICSHLSECEGLEKCTGDVIETNPVCFDPCAEITKCDLFPHYKFGKNNDDCLARCTSFALIGEMNSMVSLCIINYLPSLYCDTEVLDLCFLAPDESICNDSCTQAAACKLTDKPFDTIDHCISFCNGFYPGLKLSFSGCISSAFCTGLKTCNPPPEKLIPDAEDFCVTFKQLCPGQKPKILDNIFSCRRFLSGIDKGFAGKAEFETGITCLSQITDVCTSKIDQAVLCLTPVYSPCIEYCNKLVSCGLTKNLLICQKKCSSDYLKDPDITGKIILCVKSYSCSEVTKYCLE